MKKYQQGKVSLVLLWAAVAVPLLAAGCSDYDSNDYYNRQQNVTRAGYNSLEECVKDWNSEDCERNPNASTTASNLTGTSGSSGSGGGGVYHSTYWGPYYSSSAGQVYHYNGNTSALAKPPSNAVALQNSAMTASQMHSSSPKYTGTAKVARGGFGSFGRGSSAGG